MAGIDHAPPPFFRRGPAPLALLTFYVSISLALFIADLRWHTLEFARQALSVVIDPVQRVAQMPGGLAENSVNYLQGMQALEKENTRLKQAQLENASDLQRLAQLEAENERLRKLLAVTEREKVKGQVATILYTARDPFSRKVVINKGQQSGIIAGQPAIDELGIIGQVTRVFPFSSEVTLVTDKDQVVPVQVVRSGQRSVAYGLGNGLMELRFMAANADIVEGDMLVTSGLDGVYVAGFPVAKVVRIERDSAYSFARIFCVPIGGVENFSELVVLDPRSALPPAPPESSARPRGAGDKPGLPETRRAKKVK